MLTSKEKCPLFESLMPPRPCRALSAMTCNSDDMATLQSFHRCILCLRVGLMGFHSLHLAPSVRRKKQLAAACVRQCIQFINYLNTPTGVVELWGKGMGAGGRGDYSKDKGFTHQKLPRVGEGVVSF